MAKGVKTGGRTKGTPNKATKDIRALAQRYTERAIARLAHLMENAESEQAQVTACKELIDRGHGKSTQPITPVDGDGKPVAIRVRFVDGPGRD